MKETVSANVGGRAFTMDRDAYAKLSSYLGNVNSRLEDQTTIEDIEARAAEILAELLPSSAMVVTMAMVEQAIVRIGPAEQFGAVRNAQSGSSQQACYDSGVRKLRRSRTDRSIAGVCGGLANYLEVDSTAMRIVMLLFLIFGGMSLWVYIILWLLIPEE